MAQKKLAIQRQYERQQEVKAAKQAAREAEVERVRKHNERYEFGDYEPRYNTSKRLNKYDIHAQNRRGQAIAHATATGSKKMREARQRIYTAKSTWVKFATYNQTRKKFLKG